MSTAERKESSDHTEINFAFTTIPVPSTISFLQEMPYRYVNSVYQIDQNCPELYRLKPGATRPSWWPPAKDTCQFRCCMCGSKMALHKNIFTILTLDAQHVKRIYVSNSKRKNGRRRQKIMLTLGFSFIGDDSVSVAHLTFLSCLSSIFF